MLKRMRLIAGAISSSAVLFATNGASAAVGTGGGYIQPGGLGTWINNALNVALGAAGFVAVIYVIMGGFNYVTSAGNAEKVATANKTIAYAIIGIVIIALAFAMKGFILTRLNISPSEELF